MASSGGSGASASAPLPPLQPPGLKHVTLWRLGGQAAATASSSSTNPNQNNTITSAVAAAAASAASAPPGSVALLVAAKEPVNSMDASLWRELHTALRACERDPLIRSVVICSGLKRDVFTAGNDLKELYAPLTSEQRYADFWDAQSSFLCDLLISPLATAAAIRGACPAGGCCLALCCDRRIITGTKNSTMGLNEVALGIPVPKFWARLMALRCGPREAERLCLGGEQVGPAEALRLGLVDEVVEDEADKAAVVKRAVGWAAKQARLPPQARHDTKLALRGEFASAWRAYASTEEARYGWGAISDPATVAKLRGVLEKLSGGGSGSKL